MQDFAVKTEKNKNEQTQSCTHNHTHNHTETDRTANSDFVNDDTSTRFLEYTKREYNKQRRQLDYN